jgi:hypothetical protein
LSFFEDFRARQRSQQQRKNSNSAIDFIRARGVDVMMKQAKVVRTIEELGEPNDEAAIGNPLRGLAGGSRWAAVPLPESIVPFTIEWCNIGVRLLSAFVARMNLPSSGIMIIGPAQKGN